MTAKDRPRTDFGTSLRSAADVVSQVARTRLYTALHDRPVVYGLSPEDTIPAASRLGIGGRMGDPRHDPLLGARYKIAEHYHRARALRCEAELALDRAVPSAEVETRT
jgi:hypothetical protein